MKYTHKSTATRIVTQGDKSPEEVFKENPDAVIHVVTDENGHILKTTVNLKALIKRFFDALE